jgi:23S rRNA U2552 (ribose-2'-O)-methylase RlmE/FtsJ
MERNSAPPWQKARTMISLPTELSFGPWTECPSKALLEAKDRISALEAARRWELVKKMVNPYEIVYTHEDRFFHPSIALIKPLSRSYFKMIEMMHVLQFFEGLPKQLPKIRSAHVAEGPGGFIQALVELCERNKKILSSATAMTLKATDQRVPGWRRASTFLNHHREIKLHFGTDGTGDVYKLENQDSFVAATAPGVHLFTADGGFDFSVNYDVQEKAVFRLLVASAVTGLRCLCIDGAFILKIFDVFSEHTKFLIILMSRCFKEWLLYKPALSRPCNSERYFLGKGFKGLPIAVLEELHVLQEHAAKDLYPIDVSACISEYAAYFDDHIRVNTEEQLKAIEQAETYAIQPEQWYTKQLPIDFETSRAWCERFRIPYSQKYPSIINPSS